MPADRVADHFAEELSPPDWATDLLVCVHGRQTSSDSALAAVRRLLSAVRMLPPTEPYLHAALDHRFVSVDASDVFVRGKGPAGAHSDHLRPETEHLLLSLAAHSG
ncbi:hypothetical protein [Streptomyces tibetensis]|uniref:hypothetical protein n=1 Tax=Streptomyces tibetensis TaxID=2382123 RepID=UPI0033EFE0D0